MAAIATITAEMLEASKYFSRFDHSKLPIRPALFAIKPGAPPPLLLLWLRRCISESLGRPEIYIDGVQL
ncbi:hypothetical protein FOPG_17654 [Fusarium oxysporum f. sp. conglutinans race 2 54008]|uniref:Uncharacterized protein n=1 Tax=Fusarium oxysporum f. sp. conglutinans race 2 54008 TaxID=1089457 RepID=X0H268_FUSOX|nr:hypothetical protein FOPG_17654 [Fusarium oxysporum f. sp. conglutinans race 2 54008]